MEDLKTGELRYRALKKRMIHKLVYGLILWVIAYYSLIFLQADSVVMGIAYFFPFVFIIIWGFWLRMKIYDLFAQVLDLDAYRYYLSISKPGPKIEYIFMTANSKSELPIAEGEFQEAKEILEAPLDDYGLERVSNGIKLKYFRNLALVSIYLSNEKAYQEWLQRLQQVEVRSKLNRDFKNESVERLKATYDLVLRKRANPYFENLKTRNKLSYLNNLYYKALNAQLSQDQEAAHAYFQELAQENAQLYIVRRAKEELEKMEQEGLVSRGDEGGAGTMELGLRSPLAPEERRDRR